MSRRNRREIYNQDQPFVQGASLQEASDALYGMIESIDLSPEALTINDDGVMQFKRFTLTKSGLKIPKDATLEEMQEIGEILFRVNQSLQWWLGDFVCFLQDKDKENERQGDATSDKNFRWKHTYETLAIQFQYSTSTLQNFASVARKVKVSRRREKLSFGHHQAVQNLDSEDQIRFLEMAEEDEWSVAKLRKEVKEFREAQKSHELGIKYQPTVNSFQKRFENLKKWKENNLSDADPEELTIIAKMLRRLADEIESGK